MALVVTAMKEVEAIKIMVTGEEMEEEEARRVAHPNKGDIGQSICMIF